MHKLTFFPLGNADCCRIDLEGGEKILFDYADMRCAEDDSDLRIDLPAELRQDLKAANRDFYDVVGYSHLDRDHICGSSQFFYLEHATKFQSADRIKIRELWVPAAAIIEEGCEDEDRIVRAEARYRLKNGSGIRVFSRPEELKEWLQKEGLTLESRSHLITDAGQLIPGFSLGTQKVEFFVHSPFATRLNGDALIDRNIDSLVLQATFVSDGVLTRFFLGADLDHVALADIVKITGAKKRPERLQNDITKICHHVSYTAIGPEKGKEKTQPVPEIKWMMEEQLPNGAILIGTCNPIPSDDSDVQPPHRQAAAYYQDCADAVGGQFKVTMEYPSKYRPEKLIIEIDSSKGRIKKKVIGGAVTAVASRAPRAGA
jgi:hypothetical protein